MSRYCSKTFVPGKIDWDEVLSGELLAKWKTLMSQFEGATISIPRYYFGSTSIAPCTGSLHGFCDASEKAFAAVTYLKFRCMEEYHTKFLVSKTRVAPLRKQTIPRLGLLSALLFARLMSNVVAALQMEIP